MTSRLLVHAILAAADLRAVDLAALSDGDDPLGSVEGGGVAALVTRFDGDDPVPTRAALLRHAGIVERASEAVTVVPMRYGVVAPGDQDLVDDVLEPKGGQLAETIHRLRGCQEFRLRAHYDEPEVLRRVLQRDRRAAQLRGRRGTDARIELGERMVQGIEAQRQVDAQRALDALGPHAVDHRGEPVGAPLDAFTISFLVRADDREAFEAAVDRFGEDVHPLLAAELVGPMPAYSFTGGVV